jgi:hypothetical protein
MNPIATEASKMLEMAADSVVLPPSLKGGKMKKKL